jgi:hypothetical protein
MPPSDRDNGEDRNGGNYPTAAQAKQNPSDQQSIKPTNQLAVGGTQRATILPTDHWDNRRNVSDLREMAPQGLALKHKAAGVLTEWAQFGCPTRTGRDWTLSEIQVAIERGPHQSALEPDAIVHFANKVTSKVNKGQMQVVLWDNIKTNHPRQLKVSPVAVIPHKSRAYRSILDLSFAL